MKLETFHKYSSLLAETAAKAEFDKIGLLASCLRQAWRRKKQVFLCGNGGSAGNAIHIANDLIYGIAKNGGKGIRAKALTSNISIITCLANDISFEDVFSRQIDVLANPGDILIALSGSGNSANIVKAIKRGKEMGMKTFAIVGYSGGVCKNIADVVIHFPVNDMQVAEDMQLAVGHMIMQWLRECRPGKK